MLLQTIEEHYKPIISIMNIVGDNFVSGDNKGVLKVCKEYFRSTSQLIKNII